MRIPKVKMVEQAIACGGLDKSDMYCPRGSLASTRAVALKFGFNIFYDISIFIIIFEKIRQPATFFDSDETILMAG